MSHQDLLDLRNVQSAAASPAQQWARLTTGLPPRKWSRRTEVLLSIMDEGTLVPVPPGDLLVLLQAFWASEEANND